jgi:hypothetical protein
MESGLETGQLRVWEGVKKGLKENDGLAKASIQVVMNGVKELPMAVRMAGIARSHFFHSRRKARIKLIDQIG